MVLLVDLHDRFDVLLNRISECRWHELEDRYIDEYIGPPSEW